MNNAGRFEAIEVPVCCDDDCCRVVLMIRKQGRGESGKRALDLVSLLGVREFRSEVG
jgi:hypothetical protein